MTKTFDILTPADNAPGMFDTLISTHTSAAARDWLSRKGLRIDYVMRSKDRSTVGVVAVAKKAVH